MKVNFTIADTGRNELKILVRASERFVDYKKVIFTPSLLLCSLSWMSLDKLGSHRCVLGFLIPDLSANAKIQAAQSVNVL